jgi:acyl-CoA synthetase (AMP-forming)/AMP-acid ligase II
VTVFDQIGDKLFTVRSLVDAGFISPTRPDKLVKVARVLQQWGPTPAAGYTTSAIRYPDEPAIIDDLGTLTFREVHERTNALAHALAARGVGEGEGVAIMARNHRGFVEAVVALSKLGANALYLNTMFSGPQIKEVCEREGPKALIYDAEFAGLCAGALEGRDGFVAWVDPGEQVGDPVLEDLIRGGDRSDVVPPKESGRVTILTSGTTGTPKGAGRKQPDSLEPAAQLFSMIPLKARERTHIAAPMFHSWGFLHFTLGMGLSSTLVLRRRFSPEGMLEAVDRERCSVLAVVPVMLQRALELPEETIARHDLSCLRVIAASGSALPGELATRVMDRLGDVLYNLYGSTEVAWATIATPQDMRSAPGTAGRPPRGTIVRLYDEQGRPVPPGATGRIFIGNKMAFEGYTGGGGKEKIDGLLSSGDVGHFDAAGRLFVDGRDDEMIVSGGENVFPREIEDLLACHDDVEDVAVIGVDDEAFGQRLKAFVVRRGDAAVTADDLKAHIKANTASFKVPRDVVFLPELPRNATGKVLKRDLRDA